MIIDQTGVASLEVTVRTPTAAQEKFIRPAFKRKIIKAGRRFGKTIGVSIWNVEQFCDGYRCLYAVPVADQLEAFWLEVREALAPGIESGLLVKNETEHLIEWSSDVIRRLDPEVRKKYLNNRIRGKTAYNADTLRGDYADRLTLDEVQLMNEDAWQKVGAPMLMQNNGDVIFCFTPPSLRSRSASKATDKQWATKFYREHLEDPRWLCCHFTSYDNPTLSAEGIAQVTKDMTRLAIRQEIMAEEVDETPGALWSCSILEETRVRPEQVPPLVRIVVGVDPSGSSTNEAGIVTSGLGKFPANWEPTPDMLKRCPDWRDQQHMYVVEDASLLAPTSQAWAQRAVNAYYERKADRIVGEANYGGDMVQSTIRQATGGTSVPYMDARATRGKVVRAEPVAAAYERGLVHHVGCFPELEDEMTNYVPGDKSPNRMDAMVWCGIFLIEWPASSATVGSVQGEMASPPGEEKIRLTRPVMGGILTETI
jgi:hypothetical protein